MDATKVGSKILSEDTNIGPEDKQSKQVRILNRVVGWHGGKGISYEVDPRHAEIILEQLDFEKLSK